MIICIQIKANRFVRSSDIDWDTHSGQWTANSPKPYVIKDSDLMKLHDVRDCMESIGALTSKGEAYNYYSYEHIKVDNSGDIPILHTVYYTRMGDFYECHS